MHSKKTTVIFTAIFVGKEKKEIFKFKQKTSLKHISIGICGCTNGCGVTHLTIALANYCASKLRYSTACVELNQTNAFSELTKYPFRTLPPSKQKKNPIFSIYDVDYYPNSCCDDIPMIFNNGYFYLLLDFGVLTEHTWKEFLRCDLKIVIGSLVPWKANMYHQFFQTYLSDQTLWKNISYFVLFGDKKEIHRFSVNYHIFMQQIPFFQNPFHIEKEFFPFLQGLLT